MNPTKLIQSVIAVVVSVWLFCIGLVVGTRQTRSKIESAALTQTTAYQYQTSPQQSTAVPSSVITDAAVTTTVPQQQSTDATAGTTSQPPVEESTDAVLKEITDKQSIVDIYVNAVNKTKSLQNFSLTRDDTLNLILDDVTGGSIIKSIGNQLVSSAPPHDVENLVFQNGVDLNGSGEIPSLAIPPMTSNASLDPNALLSASAIPNSYGGYTISLALIDEVQTLASPATNHSTTMEIIDVAALGLPDSMTIQKLDITYSGATIVAETDGEGRIAVMTHHLPVSHAEGTGKYGIISAEVKIHGDFTCIYTLTY